MAKRRRTATGGGPKIWTAEEARQHLAEWAASGESLAAYSRRKGLVPQRLAWWRKRLAGAEVVRLAPKGPANAAPAIVPTFLPVTVRRPTCPGGVMLEVGSGVRVALSRLDETTATWVARLVRALEDRP